MTYIEARLKILQLILDYKLASQSMEDDVLLRCPEAMCAHLDEMQDVTDAIDLFHHNALNCKVLGAFFSFEST